MRFGILARTALAVAVAAAAVSPALARDPAVSALNVKVTAEAGPVEDEGAWLGVVALTAPLSNEWGVQGEIGVFSFDGDPAYGLAGHAFTRDPARYLLGAFGAYAHEDNFDLDAGRVGVEGEYYLEHLTFTANTGYQFGDGFVSDTWFGEVQASWYANNDFVLTGGVAFDEDIALTHFGAEWLIGGGSSLPGLALRGDVHIGDNDYDSVMGGITYYFGPDASLKDRHRRQDPDSALLDLLHSVEASCEQTEQPTFAKAFVVLPPPVSTCGEETVLPPG
jgi:hypothetical protein